LTTVGIPTFNPTMRVLVFAEVPGIEAADDDEMAGRLGFADGSADGCRFRISGPLPGGGRRIMTLWDSLEAYEAWRDERLAKALQATGHPVPKMEVWQVDRSHGV
jgi:hypothetical protein